MITATMEQITPEKAKEYLEHNTNNYRTLMPATVKSYAADMAAGKWEENGEPIAFDETGALKNGQHRLNAIMTSGKTIPILVVRGVPKDTEIYDFGKNRTVAQWGMAIGKPVPGAMSGAARILVSGFRAAAAKGVITSYITKNYEDLRTAFTISATGRKDGPGRKAACVLAIMICRRYQMATDELLRDFFWILNTGTVQKGAMRDPSPALVCSRQFLTELNGGNAATQAKQYSVIMHGIADYRKNKNRQIKYKPEDYAMDVLNAFRRDEGFQETNA